MPRFVLLLAFLVLAISACSSSDSDQGEADAVDLRSGITEREAIELDRIATLGYFGSGAASPDTSGVIRWLPGAHAGYTICTSFGSSGAYILDMNGHVLHTWVDTTGKEWVRARPRADGSVLGIQRFPGQILALDRESRRLWAAGNPLRLHSGQGKLIETPDNPFKGLYSHHDLVMQQDGSVSVLMRAWGRLPSYLDQAFVKDLIYRLVPQGTTACVADSLSIANAFLRSDYADVFLAALSSGSTDPTHANSIEFLEGHIPHPAFSAGNVLVSMRNLDCLAVIDLDSRKVVWISQTIWQRQHEARETPQGTILLFDNRPDDKHSRIVEYDPVNDAILWEYSEPGFFSELEGCEEILPNGNLLVTESRKGRLLEITGEGRILWEYVSPMRTDDGANIAVIPRAHRVAYDFFTGDFGDSLRTRRLSGREYSGGDTGTP